MIVRVPPPLFVRPMLPVILVSICNELDVLYWFTIRSCPFPEVRLVPPVIVVRLLPTFGETRIPPLVMEYEPLSVAVVAAAAASRRAGSEAELRHAGADVAADARGLWPSPGARGGALRALHA